MSAGFFLLGRLCSDYCYGLVSMYDTHFGAGETCGETHDAVTACAGVGTSAATSTRQQPSQQQSADISRAVDFQYDHGIFPARDPASDSGTAYVASTFLGSAAEQCIIDQFLGESPEHARPIKERASPEVSDSTA